MYCSTSLKNGSYPSAWEGRTNSSGWSVLKTCRRCEKNTGHSRRRWFASSLPSPQKRQEVGPWYNAILAKWYLTAACPVRHPVRIFRSPLLRLWVHFMWPRLIRGRKIWDCLQIFCLPVISSQNSAHRREMIFWTLPRMQEPARGTSILGRLNAAEPASQSANSFPVMSE